MVRALRTTRALHLNTYCTGFAPPGRSALSPGGAEPSGLTQGYTAWLRDRRLGLESWLDYLGTSSVTLGIQKTSFCCTSPHGASQVFGFYKLKARPSTSQKVKLTLLWRHRAYSIAEVCLYDLISL